MTHHAFVFIKYQSLVMRSPSGSLLVDCIYIHLHIPANALGLCMHSVKAWWTTDEVNTGMKWKASPLEDVPVRANVYVMSPCMNTVSVQATFHASEALIIPDLWSPFLRADTTAWSNDLNWYKDGGLFLDYLPSCWLV